MVGCRISRRCCIICNSKRDIFWIKSNNRTYVAPQMKSFGPKNFQIPCSDQKVPFWQFFRKGRDGRALIVRPLRIPHRNSKILFALGADEFLVMLEAKLERPHFIKVQSGKIIVRKVRCRFCGLLRIYEL
jgi:hypothetical protein